MKRRDFLASAAALVAMTALPRGVVMAAAATSPLGVIKGATPIDQGMAIHANDFTIYNNKIAASFAVGSNNYWNMTSGSILDIALVKDGKFGVDLVNDVEFLNDLWAASGSYNSEDLLHVPAKDISYVQDKDKIIVTAKTRYWSAGHKLPLNVTIEYTLGSDKNYIGLVTKVENPAGNEPYENVYSGYSLSTLAANMFGPFGYYPDLKTTGLGIGADQDVQEKLGDFVVTYGKDYAVSLQVDDANSYKGSSGYKDLYINRTIEAGKTYVYTGEILVLDKGETAPVLERWLEKNPEVPAAVVQGEIKDSSGKAIPNAFVIVSKSGAYKETVKSHGADTLKKDIMQPLVWKMADKNGRFTIKLPQDQYSMHVEAMGYTPSDSQVMAIAGDKIVNFTVKDGAKAVFKVVDENGKPLKAKVTVGDTTATVKTLGGKVFFTDPKTDEVRFDIAAPENEITFTVTHASDFETLPVVITKKVNPRETVAETVTLPTLIQTSARKWYSADIHEHSDIGDGGTSVTDLHKAQLAAGLNLLAISDHDSVGNNATMAKLSKGSEMPFLSSLEVSPGWGHWGILGMDYTKKPISPNLAPAEIIKAGHDMGALVVMNHPYTDYGFLHNRDSVKGGHDAGTDDFDLIEIQSTIDFKDVKNMDKKALDAAMAYWNKGKKIYLSSGSDQHDVTSGLYPGIIRLYAHVDGELTSKAYLQAMKAGNSYITMGPIITPAASSMFGTTREVKAGEALDMNLELQAVHGLKSVQVYCEGEVVASKEFGGTKDAVNYKVDMTPKKNTWYNFVVFDEKGRSAITNPIWVSLK